MNKEQILKIIKNKNNLTIFLIFIIGVVLMIMSGGHKKNTIKPEESMSAAASVTSEEARLEAILSQIDGAGEVSVMITYYSGSEKNLAYETKSASRSEGSETSEEKKAVTSGGEPMVVKEVYPRVKGVIVAAEGADNPAVKAAIHEAAMASLDVSAHRICIFKKEEE